MIQKSITFLKEVKSELSQVSWPPLPELWASTRVVLAVTVILSVIIGLFDLICARLMAWIVR